MTHRLVDQVDDHFGRAHGVYGSALSDMALMMKSMGQHKEATNTYLKALEVPPTPEICWPLRDWKFVNPKRLDAVPCYNTIPEEPWNTFISPIHCVFVLVEVLPCLLIAY